MYHQGLRKDKAIREIKRSKPKPLSNKQIAKNRLYSIKRHRFLKAHPLCSCKHPGCEGVATEIHHIKGRGTNFLNDKTWLPVCRPCHIWIEMNPLQAKKLGFSQTRLTE
jgi:hypothetical protein